MNRKGVSALILIILACLFIVATIAVILLAVYTGTIPNPLNSIIFNVTHTQQSTTQHLDVTACNDGLDNDGDGFVDMQDRGCSSPNDTSELSQCQNNIDDDYDGWIDMEDPGCSSVQDDNEINDQHLTQCSDEIDNDNDTLIDGYDDGCNNSSDNSESSAIDIVYECNDSIDNDHDGNIDYPNDSGCINAQDNSETNPLFLIDIDFSTAVWAINQNERLGERAYSLNNAVVDPNDDCVPEPGLIESCLSGAYSWCNSSQGGTDVPNVRYMILDVEPCSFRLLTEPLWSQSYNQSVTGLIEMLRRAKAARPNVKWSIYAVPAESYWLPSGTHANANQSDIDASIARAIAPQRVYDALDFVAPSVYDPYKDPTNTADDRAYIRDHIIAAKQAAPNKLILPYIWHRYNAGPYLPTFELVPMQEFLSEQVNASLYYGADGVIWWGADSYYFKVALNMTRDDAIRGGVTAWDWDRLQTVFQAELPPQIPRPLQGPWPRQDLNNYIDQLQTSYLRALASFMHQSS